jgi:hypothetical protein
LLRVYNLSLLLFLVFKSSDFHCFSGQTSTGDYDFLCILNALIALLAFALIFDFFSVMVQVSPASLRNLHHSSVALFSWSILYGSAASAEQERSHPVLLF